MANFELIKEFTKVKEGGLSRAKTDTASKHPAPCTYKGYNDWHTNKGITWKTFSTVAKSLGVEPSCKVFFEMPENVWYAITKRIYWDGWNLDNFPGQATANLLFQSGFGSGMGGALQMWNKYFNTNFKTNKELAEYLGPKANTKQKDKALFIKMWQYRLNWLLSLPNQEPNYKGWQNRMNDLKELSLNQIEKKNSNKGIFFAILAGLLIYNYSK